MRDPVVTTPQQITERVLRSFDGCPTTGCVSSCRGLPRHLHAFASEVGPDRRGVGAGRSRD